MTELYTLSEYVMQLESIHFDIIMTNKGSLLLSIVDFNTDLSFPGPKWRWLCVLLRISYLCKRPAIFHVDEWLTSISYNIHVDLSYYTELWLKHAFPTPITTCERR